MTAHERIIHALTRYDDRQSKKRGYNPHALALSFEALERTEEDAAKLLPGQPFSLNGRMEESARKFFCDRLLDVVLKAINGQ